MQETPLSTLEHCFSTEWRIVVLGYDDISKALRSAAELLDAKASADSLGLFSLWSCSFVGETWQVY